MKRFLTIITVFTFIIAICIPVNASNVSSYIVTIENVDVMFENNTAFDLEEKQIIAEYIANNAPSIQTYGLICNLFGHKNTTELVISTAHGVNSTQPKCLKEYWEITTCSRCNYTEGTIIDSFYINCCE